MSLRRGILVDARRVHAEREDALFRIRQDVGQPAVRTQVGREARRGAIPGEPA